MNPSERKSASGLATVSPSDAEALYLGPWVQAPSRLVPDRRRSNQPFAACEVVFRGSLARWFGVGQPRLGLSTTNHITNQAITN